MVLILGCFSEVWLREGTCEPVRLRSETEYVVPASTLKSIWAVILLNELGANYRIPTYVAAKGNALIFRFTGDYTLSFRKLDSIVSAKVSRMKGKRVYVLISFPPWRDRYGYGWAWDDIKFRRVSPITPVSINGGVVRSDTLLGIRVDTSLAVDSVVLLDTVAFIPKKVYRYSDPLSFVKYVVRRAILKAGKRPRIEVQESGTFSFKGLKVDTVYSPPLKDILRPILTYSINFSMDMVVAHYSGGITKAGRYLRRFMGNLGMDTTAYVFDGSGLSRYNLIRAIDAVYLVCAGTRGMEDVVKEVLPSPGKGTLKRRLVEFSEMVHAKTGTLFGVSALLGFYTGCNDRYVFGIYVQNSPITRHSRDFIDSLVVWSSGGKDCLTVKKEESKR